MRAYTYNTKQKQLIFDLLKNNSEIQFTCDEISDSLKKVGTPVGKATLYRHLDKLCYDGFVRKYFDSKSATYQFVDKKMNCDEHMHLKCTYCGKLVHLGCEFMSTVSEHIKEHHNFKVDNSKTVILGVCDHCSEKTGV